MAHSRRDFFKLSSLAGLLAGLGKFKLPEKKPVIEAKAKIEDINARLAKRETLIGPADFESSYNGRYEEIRNQYGEIVAIAYFP